MYVVQLHRETEAFVIPTSLAQHPRKKLGLVGIFVLFVLAAFTWSGSSAHALMPSVQVTTGDTENLYDNSATFTGSLSGVNFDPTINEIGFYYWEDDGMPYSDHKPGAKKLVGQFDNGNSGTFSAYTGLELDPNKNYVYVAYFAQDKDIEPERVHGQQKEFLTYWYFAYPVDPEIRDLPNGTTSSQIQWPDKVTVYMPDYQTTFELPVTWNYTDYEEDEFSQYPTGWSYSDIGGFKSFPGTIAPDPNRPNITFDPRGGSRSNVTINIELAYSTLLSIPTVPNFNLPLGSSLSDTTRHLPNSLVGSFSNGKSAALPVEWDEGTPTFDGATAGSYTFTGKLGCLIEQLTFAAPKQLYGASARNVGAQARLSCGYENPTNIQPTAIARIGQTTPPAPVDPTPSPSPAPTVTSPAPRTVQVVVTNPGSGQQISEQITRNIGPNLSMRGMLYNAAGQPVPGVSELTLSPTGALTIPPSLPAGTYRLALNVIAPNGERLAGPPAQLTISANGNARLDSELIDPYGIITDSRTGQPVEGVTVTLYWADTELNRSKGRVPGQMVALPELPDFAPNRNLDPQDSNAAGQYGWMVYPEGDYYIMGEKDGYLTFDSRNEDKTATFGTDSYIRDGMIHVGQTIVEYNFEIEPDSQSYVAYMRGYPDGKFRPERGVVRSEVAAILHRTMVTPTASSPQSFTDVPKANWAVGDIDLVVSNGWMKGTGASTFSPNREVTRGEMAQILMNVYGWSSTDMQPFSDTSGHWAEKAIRAAAAEGVLIGYSDGTFRPDQPITRVETVKLINRLTERPAAPQLPMTWSDVPVSTPDYGDIMAASIDHVAKR